LKEKLPRKKCGWKNPNKDFLRPKTESIYQNKNILNKLQSQKAL